MHKLHHLVIFVYGSMAWAKHRSEIIPYCPKSPLSHLQCKAFHLNGVQTRFKCKLDVKRCKRFVFPPSSLLPRSNALKTKAIRYFQTDRTLTRIVSPPLIHLAWHGICNPSPITQDSPKCICTFRGVLLYPKVLTMKGYLQ